MIAVVRISCLLFFLCFSAIIHAQSPVLRIKNRPESLAYFEELYKSQLETITEE